jgi:hypothetical protein
VVVLAEQTILTKLEMEALEVGVEETHPTETLVRLLYPLKVTMEQVALEVTEVGAVAVVQAQTEMQLRVLCGQGTVGVAEFG